MNDDETISNNVDLFEAVRANDYTAICRFVCQTATMALESRNKRHQQHYHLCREDGSKGEEKRDEGNLSFVLSKEQQQHQLEDSLVDAFRSFPNHPTPLSCEDSMTERILRNAMKSALQHARPTCIWHDAAGVPISDGAPGIILHTTIVLRRPLLLAFFLTAGANAKTLHTAFGRTILHEAANSGSLECLQLLLELHHEEEPTVPPPPLVSVLHLFHQLGHQVERMQHTALDAARALLRYAPPRTLGLQTTDNHGNTPLHWAAFKHQTEIVRLLLSYGADPNATAQPSGWTPLHDAAYSNATGAMELLIRAGANVDATANSGATPLCFAAQEDAAEAAELLLIRGADMTIRCSPPTRNNHHHHHHSRFSGYTPLHYCAHYNSHHAVRVLLQHHTAKLQVRDVNGRLPIHVAVARGSSNVLREFLRAGAKLQPIVRAPARMNPTSSLRAMIPSRPVESSKPWNCLSQRSIDECRQLINVVERQWDKEVHSLFTPADRNAVAELLRVGKRLELDGSVTFTPLWCEVLSFCGRGWFEVEGDDTETEVQPEEGPLFETRRPRLPSFC